MASAIQRGKAALLGIAGTIDLVVYPVAQSATFTQNFEEEVVKDVNGFDTAWIARNLHYLADFKFKMLGDTAAHAGGVTMIAPYATVTLSTFALADLNATYQNISGQAFDLSNTSVADFATKFRKYGDTTQNTLSQTTPA